MGRNLLRLGTDVFTHSAPAFIASGDPQTQWIYNYALNLWMFELVARDV
jgi:hypothetical protein